MVQAIPEGVGNVVPYLSIRGAKKAIEFYQAAFNAELVSLMPMGDDFVAHADLRIGSSRVYLADEMPAFGAVKSPKTLKGTSVNIHLWVEDCDAAFAQAVAAGAAVLMPLTDQFWGDRFGMVSDPFGHVWAISSQKEDLTPEEVMRRSEQAMANMPPPGPAPKPKAKKAKAQSRGKATPSTRPAPKSAAVASKPRPSAPGPVAPLVDVAESKKDKKAKKGKKEKKSKSKKDKKRKKKSKR